MDICLYFQVHQPLRLLEYTFFQIGKNHYYENAELNQNLLNRISDNCYLPANAILLKLIKANPGKFKITFSITGIVLEQFKIFRPDVLKSFQELAKTGAVEFLGETYYHSLSFIYDKAEFEYQVKKQEQILQELFGLKPTVFRNTELIYNNDLADYVQKMGYNGILSEGVSRILKQKSPHVCYKSAGANPIPVLLRDYLLTDDIAFRFGDKKSPDYPLTPKKFVQKISILDKEAKLVNIFMDYETFGEHKHEETGIFKFLEKMPSELIAHNITFKTPSEIVHLSGNEAVFDVPEFISWADTQRDLSAWLSNSMQYESLSKLYSMKHEVLSVDDIQLTNTWRKLQTSDHFYYMCTKYMADGDIHKYFSPFNTPYDAYIYYMNVISDFEIVLKKTPKYKTPFLN